MVQWMQYYLILLLSVTVTFDLEEVSEFHLQRNLRASWKIRREIYQWSWSVNWWDINYYPSQDIQVVIKSRYNWKAMPSPIFFLGALEVYDNYAIVATWWLTRDIWIPQSGRQSSRSRHYIHDDAFIDTQIDEILIIIPCKIHEQWH